MKPIDTITIEAGGDKYRLANQPNSEGKYGVLVTKGRLSHMIGSFDAFYKAQQAIFNGDIDARWDWMMSANNPGVIDGRENLDDYFREDHVVLGIPVNVYFEHEKWRPFSLNTPSYGTLQKNQNGDIALIIKPGRALYLYYANNNSVVHNLVRLVYVNPDATPGQTTFEDSPISDKTTLRQDFD